MNDICSSLWKKRLPQCDLESFAYKAKILLQYLMPSINSERGVTSEGYFLNVEAIVVEPLLVGR